jgi:hypothetical protein
MITYIFIHVPKTGGTTLRKHFGSQMDSYEFIHLAKKGNIDSIEKGLKPYVERDINSRKRAKVILGHFVNIDTKSLIDSNKSKQIVIFRDPKSWLISKYNQRMNHRKNFNMDIISFKDWIRQDAAFISQFDWFICNFMKVKNYQNLTESERIKIVISSIQEEIDEVWHISQIDKKIKSICRELKINETLERYNVSGRGPRHDFFIPSLENIAKVEEISSKDYKLYSLISENYFSFLTEQ